MAALEVLATRQLEICGEQYSRGNNQRCLDFDLDRM
jgi:hypothetical protein